MGQAVDMPMLDAAVQLINDLFKRFDLDSRVKVNFPKRCER